MQVRSYIPEERRRRQKRRFYFVWTSALFIAYFLVLGWLWFLYRSPFFSVNHIVVNGNTSVSSDAVVSLVESTMMPPNHALSMASIIGYKNMLIWPSSIPSRSLAWIPQLSSVSIGRDYFSHTITITVTERTPLAVWCYMPKESGDEQCFWFDGTGDKFERTYDTQGNVITVVHDFSGKPTGVNQPILPEPFVANLISIIHVIKNSHVNVATIALNDLSLEELNVTTLNGPSLYFSLRFPADNYLDVINQLMENQTMWHKIAYVDCRTENRVYYK
ncbi:MAG TPA: hypothetical protein VMU07_03875 [Candidatus Paceibacterota bacterium]|nr:hypothetical protein [Candidatus Paceibacterota bacterium]